MTGVDLPAARPRVFTVTLFLLTVGLDALDCLPRAGRWLGWFPATIHHIENLNRFGDVVAAVAAALLAQTARRFGLGAWGAAAVRGHERQAVAVVAGSVVPVLAAHTLVATAMLTGTISRDGATGGGLWAALAVATGPLLTIGWAAVGVLLGLRLPRVVAPALAALLPTATVMLLDVELADTPAAVLTYASSGNYTDARPANLDLVLRLLVAICLCTGIAAVLARRQLLAAASCCSVALTAAFLLGGAKSEIPGADTLVCSGREPSICVPRSAEAGAVAYRRIIDSVWRDLPTPLRRQALDPYAVDDAARRHAIPAAPVDDNIQLSLVPTRASSIEALGEAAWFTPDGCERVGPNDQLAFKVWWLNHFGISTDGSGYNGTNLQVIEGYPTAQRQAEALDHMTPAQRDVWVARALTSGLRCSHTP